VIGGKLDSLGGTNARLGLGEYMVAEADESDGTFLLLSPTVAIVTNIDPEHLDHYGSVQALEDAFLTFTNRVPFYGFGVMCVDHPVVQSLLPNVRRRVVTYGFARHADYRAAKLRVSGISSVFDVYRHNVLLGEVCIDLPGKHNVSNALAAIATSVELSVPFEEVAKALNGFSGLQRRFSLRGDVGGVKVIDDYAHHPVEIQATLEATMAGFRQQRIFAIFQPHRYSRASDLWDEFCAAFNGADNVLVLPVYAAGESPIDGIDHHAFAEALRGSGHRGALAMDTKDAVVVHLIENVVQGDIVITLGAGDVNAIIEPLLAGLEQRIGN
jgi:UDP-N-acetylmuramate--alanine ligase